MRRDPQGSPCFNGFEALAGCVGRWRPAGERIRRTELPVRRSSTGRGAELFWGIPQRDTPLTAWYAWR